MPAPSPPILAPRPPTPFLSTPPPQQTIATGNTLLILLYGLDLWSLLASWGSRIQALLEAQQSPSLSLQGLSAPGMCASQLLALNTTALLNTSLTAQQLMPGLGYFAMDVGGRHSPPPGPIASHAWLPRFYALHLLASHSCTSSLPLCLQVAQLTSALATALLPPSSTTGHLSTALGPHCASPSTFSPLTLAGCPPLLAP
ncbi:hypothetical protein V8C86DRAFT_2565379 [Haematococcus lacustris]